MTYKQDFYSTKQKEIDYLFLEQLAPVMKDLEHPELIKEWIQILDAAFYKKILNQYEELPSTTKKIDRNYKTDCWPKSIMESLNWLPFIDTMEFTSEKMNNDKNVFP